MSRTFTAVSGTPQVTYCTNDGTPYRTDAAGIVHVAAAHVTELTGRGLSQPTLSQLATAGHRGETQTITVENTKDHG